MLASQATVRVFDIISMRPFCFVTMRRVLPYTPDVSEPFRFTPALSADTCIIPITTVTAAMSPSPSHVLCPSPSLPRGCRGLSQRHSPTNATFWPPPPKTSPCASGRLPPYVWFSPTCATTRPCRSPSTPTVESSSLPMSTASAATP